MSESLVKPACLSRSSSIRSVPSAPKISQRHPSSSKISRNTSSQSPGANSAHTECKNKKRDVSKSKENTSKSKKNTSKSKENSPKPKENTLKSKSNTSKSKDNTKKAKDDITNLKESEMTSLCQYITENETFGSKQLIAEEDTMLSSVPVVCQSSSDVDSFQLNTNTRYQTVSAH